MELRGLRAGKRLSLNKKTYSCRAAVLNVGEKVVAFTMIKT